MAGSNLTRLLYDNLTCGGSKPTLGAGLTNAGTTITFPAALQSYGVNVPTLAADQYIPLTLSPVGDPTTTSQAERVWLTAYTASATTGTILRAQEGSSGVAHSSGEPFVLSAGAQDFEAISSSNQTGTTYTLALTDAGTVIELNNASAITLTIPTHATIAFPVGTVIELVQIGVGQVTIAGAVGVTLRSPSSLVKTHAQYSTVTIRQRATDEWVLAGDLA